MSDGMERVYERLFRMDEFKETCSRAKRGLLAAEAAAEAARRPPRTYQVSLRLTDRETMTGVSYAQRRGALVEMIEALRPDERHTATSTFRVTAHLAEASALAAFLVVPLDRSLDLLDVVEITSNHRRFGNARLL